MVDVDWNWSSGSGRLDPSVALDGMVDVDWNWSSGSGRLDPSGVWLM